MCRNVDVTIVRIESINSARWERAIRHVAMRRLLAAGIRVDMSVKAASQNEADTLCAKFTVTSMNAKLQQAGLPAATLLEAAMTAPSGDGGRRQLPVVVCSQLLSVLPLDLWSFL